MLRSLWRWWSESARISETGPLPRLFTGLEVPYDVQLALSLKRGGLLGARWIDPENYHITLCFIGDVDNHVADEVSYELDRAASFESFRLRLSHLGTFGGDKPRALYAGVENNEALQRLQATHERILRRVGLAPDARKFVPHVSLARLRGASAIEVADLIHHMGQFAPLEFTVRRFVLFSSKNSVGGGPYLVEQSYSLAAA
jgi:2'-5' RNA ligase